MDNVHDLHLSGFHEASEDEWAVVADRLRLADVGAVTECRRDIAPPGWTQYRPRRVRGAECALLWNDARFWIAGPDVDCLGHARLTDRVFYTGTGHARPGVVATWGLLCDREQRHQDVLRIVAHFPASVQRGDWFNRRNVRRVNAWRSALRGLRSTVLELRAELRPTEVVVSCDWNVDVRRLAWRLLINRGLRGTGLRLKAPPHGTHHARAIDAHATTMRRVQPVRVLVRLRGFDHLPVLGTFASRKATP